MRVSLRGSAIFSGLIVVAACGGSMSETLTTKTCAQDPTQPQCITVTPAVDSGLRFYAARNSRYMGTSLDALFGTSTAYDALVAREFSLITAGNAQKWQTIHPQRATYNYARGDQMLAFALANGMKMRGHTLAWQNQNPSWLTNGAFPADTLAQILKDHIASVLTYYKGKIYAWDVVNEALNGDGTLAATIWSNALGKGYIETAFRAARAADPAALLFYNDYNLEFAGAKQQAALALIQDFKTRGVPIDGIGFQAHFQINADGTGAPSKTSLTTTFQSFAALGVKIHITELDVRVRVPGATTTELTAQNQAYSDIAGACMAVPACEAITVWGVADSESWVPSTFPGYGSALLFDGSLAKKATWTAVKVAIGG
jgi:endo-1,4-beta-xylanase